MGSLGTLDAVGWIQLAGAIIAIFLGGLRLYEFFRDRSKLHVNLTYGRFMLLKKGNEHRAQWAVEFDISNQGRRDTTIARVQLAYNVDHGGAYIVTDLHNGVAEFKSVRLQENGREVLKLRGESFIPDFEVKYLQRPYTHGKLLLSTSEGDLEYAFPLQQVSSPRSLRF